MSDILFFDELNEINKEDFKRLMARNSNRIIHLDSNAKLTMVTIKKKTPDQLKSDPITLECKRIFDQTLSSTYDEVRYYLDQLKMYNTSTDKDYKQKSCSVCNSINYNKNTYCNNCGNKI